MSADFFVFFGVRHRLLFICRVVFLVDGLREEIQCHGILVDKF